MPNNVIIPLSQSLSNKVRVFKTMISQGRPYVWALRLSGSDFDEMERALAQSVTDNSGEHSHLICEEYAPLVVMYLAEWYKRYYKGADTTDDHKVFTLKTEELQKLYKCAGIDSNTFVYDASKVPDKTSFRWLESLQVLGGLAVQAELKRDDADQLLQKLCRIYHGEDIEIDDLKERNRAVAFQESIKNKHSLYEFLDCILSKEKEPPYAKSDYLAKDSHIHLLIERIQTANANATKNKFDIEWRISYLARHSRMVRKLRVYLKPEQIGGQHKNYIGYERLRGWGIENPEEIGRILFGVRFKMGSACVKEASFKSPIFKFDNTGSEETGFSSVLTADNSGDFATVSDIPVERFNKVEIVIKTDNSLKTIQTIDIKDYLQIYKADGDNSWSSKKNSQAQTAVVFPPEYSLANEYQSLSTATAYFFNDDENSEPYTWCPIDDKVIIVDSDGREILPPFFNRNGLYQVVIKRYLDTIKYQDNLYTTYEYVDFEDEDDSEVVSYSVPLLFGKEGIMVLHFPSRDASEGEPVAQYDLEWAPLGSKKYTLWKNQEPEQGLISLRVIVQGIAFKKNRVYYVPFTTTEAVPKPIWRDFEHIQIRTELDGVEKVIQDDTNDFSVGAQKVPEETKQIRIGTDNAHVLVDVYRPVILRELSQKKKGEDAYHVIHYYGKDEDVKVPLINCDQFSIRDFSENGVKEYRIKRDSSIYYGFSDFINVGISDSAFREERPISKLTQGIPLDYLKLYISKSTDAPVTLYAWDYIHEPYPVQSVSMLNGDGIVFQSLIKNDSPDVYITPLTCRTNAGWGGKKHLSALANPLFCFETVSEHGCYYFMFEPLIRTVAKDFAIQAIFLPLLKKRDYHLSVSDIKDLYRFALEFHFDWMLLAREKWEEQISSFATSEEEIMEIKTSILDFFVQTFKATDESEAKSLVDFLASYWSFNAYPQNLDPVAEKALKLILNDDSALRGQPLKEYLKAYDGCKCKFIEMAKSFTSSH